MVRLTRINDSTNARKRDILGLLSTAVRYIKHKVKSIYEKNSKKGTKKMIMKYIIKKS